MICMSKVCIVVVTYNRLTLLKEVVASLRNQTYKDCQILVINNGSTDGTLEWLSVQTDVITITQENCGGAGGFHTGMKYAVENGYEYCWVMDDDVIAEPNALELLVGSISRKPDIGYVCSRVIGIDGRAMNTPSVDNRGKDGCYPDFCDLINDKMIKVMSSTFVSVLVPCAIIRKVGLPYKEFFIWGDDTEFTLRISSLFDCYMACDSVAIHKRAIQKQLTIEEENDKRRLKNYFYNIRNCGFYTHKYGSIQESIIYHLWIWMLIFRNILKPYKSFTVLKGYCAYFHFRPEIIFPE